MSGGEEDTSWLYGYDAMNTPLVEPTRQKRLPCDGATECNKHCKVLRRRATVRVSPIAALARAASRSIALIHSLALDGRRVGWRRRAVEGQGQICWSTIAAVMARPSARRATYTPQLFADDLAELMDHVGWRDAVVAGCSMGGCVAQAFAWRLSGADARVSH